MSYAKKARSKAAKKGWQGFFRRFWVARSQKAIDKVPVGKVSVPVRK